MKTFHDPEAFARIRGLPTPALDATERLVGAARARGQDVIDLATGQADGPPPPAVAEALRAASVASGSGWAADPAVTAAFHRAAAAWLQRRHGLQVDPEREVVATLGTREGLGHAILALLGEGDALLAPTPAVPLHAHGAALAGGVTVPVTVGPGVDYLESLFAATERAEQRPRGLLVHFPASPTTAVAVPELVQKVVRFAEARDLFILSDLAYGETVFDGPPATPFGGIPGARERTLEFVSLGWSHGVVGPRIGFAYGNPALCAALARVKGYLAHGPSAAALTAATVALEQCDDAPAQRCARYRGRRDALARWFGAAGWPVPSPPATPFVWAPMPEPLRHLGSAEFTRRLLEDTGVAVAPGVAFGASGEGHVRIALTEDEARLQAAAERMGPWLQRVSAEPRASHTPVPHAGASTPVPRGPEHA